MIPYTAERGRFSFWDRLVYFNIDVLDLKAWRVEYVETAFKKRVCRGYVFQPKTIANSSECSSVEKRRVCLAPSSALSSFTPLDNSTGSLRTDTGC
jgi:hypothetical protein